MLMIYNPHRFGKKYNERKMMATKKKKVVKKPEEEVTKDVVVRASEQKKDLKVNFTRETIEVVKQTVFPKATDFELQLYFHKCVVNKVHPLDGLIFPSVFNTNDGRRVVFIKSIDLFRSTAESSGDYAGQDEEEFEYKDNKLFKARVKVYKKGVSRPFVGVAKWDEFYPSDAKKAFIWNKMPEGQLAKCAEAKGLRKAFPKLLHGDYLEVEMDQAANPQNQLPETGKPQLTQKTEPIKEITSPTSEDREPTDGEITQGKLISVKQRGFLKGLFKKHNVKEESLLNYLQLPSIKWVTWDRKNNTCMDKLVKTIQEQPEFFNQYESTPQQDPTENVGTVMDHEDFLKEVRALGMNAKLMTDIAINSYLVQNAFGKMDEVKPEAQSAVLDCLRYYGKK